jgi:methylamine dehydrogenase light chain
MSLFDDLVQRGTRALAGRTSRRGMLGRLGRTLGGAAIMLPVLPVDRVSRFAHAAEGMDPTACVYWRHCAFDGFLCTCCGGTSTACPAGTDVSAVTWIGTCRHPGDGKDYLIQYSDCCGKSSCGRCTCNLNEGERPAYRMNVHNDINWCMANSGSQVYHCTLAAIVGLPETTKG